MTTETTNNTKSDNLIDIIKSKQKELAEKINDSKRIPSLEKVSYITTISSIDSYKDLCDLEKTLISLL